MPLKDQMAFLTAEAVVSNHKFAESVPDTCIELTLEMLHNHVQILTAVHEWIVLGEKGDEVRKAITSLLVSHQLAIDVLEGRQHKLAEPKSRSA